MKLKHGVAAKELQKNITDQTQLVKDVKEEKKTLINMCKNRTKKQEQENEVWKVDTSEFLATKQLHTK